MNVCQGNGRDATLQHAPTCTKRHGTKGTAQKSCPKTRVKKAARAMDSWQSPEVHDGVHAERHTDTKFRITRTSWRPVTEFAIEVAFRSRAIRKLPMIAKRLVVPARSKRASDGCYPSLPFLQQGGRKSDHQFRPAAMKRWVMRVTARKGFRNVKTIGWISHYGFSFRLR